MIRSLQVLFLALLFLVSNNAISQTDSSKVQIQKEAIQMRETLNKYLSSQLLSTEGSSNSDVKASLVDSISTLISKQHLELELLKSSLKEMESSLSQISQKQEAIESSEVLVSGVRKIGTKSLELYFPFNSYSLTSQQTATLNRFLGNQKYSQIELTGFSDWVGSDAYNTKLGKRRCNAVKQNIRNAASKIVVLDPVIIPETSNKEAMFCRKVLITIN
jgi:outer membrane protein OmpA-like peptidoglycan-associated protein